MEEDRVVRIQPLAIEVQHLAVEARPDAPINEVLLDSLKLAFTERRDIMLKIKDKKLHISVSSILAGITEEAL